MNRTPSGRSVPSGFVSMPTIISRWGDAGHAALAVEGERDGRIRAVDLSCETVAVEDRLGDHPGRNAVADRVDGLDLRRLGPEGSPTRFRVERVVGDLLIHL